MITSILKVSVDTEYYLII